MTTDGPRTLLTIVLKVVITIFGTAHVEYTFGRLLAVLATTNNNCGLPNLDFTIECIIVVVLEFGSFGRAGVLAHRDG